MALFVFAIISSAFSADFNIPFAFESDSLVYAAWIKGTMEHGWYLKNPSLAAPGISDVTDFPLSDSFHFFLAKLIYFITKGNVAFVINLLYLLSYPLVACTALFAFKRLGMILPFAFAASLLFAFQTSHFFCNEVHLLLSAYYMIPIGIWLGFWLCENRIIFFSMKECGNIKQFVLKNYTLLLVSISCFIIGSCGVYYAFFTNFFILVLGISIAFKEGKTYPAKHALLAVSLISFALLINITPFLLSLWDFGRSAVALRPPYQAEQYALKIMQILLPPLAHRLKSFADFSYQYYTCPFMNLWGSGCSYIGFFAIIGFLGLIVSLFLARIRNDKLYILSRLNIGALLLGMIGGFGSLFAYTFTPMIRAYGRISIFIAFFSLFAFFILLQLVINRYSRRCTQRSLWCIAIIIMGIGIFDQTSSNFKINQPAIKMAFQSDRQFVNSIEAQIPPKSKVFQLPEQCFPECVPNGKMDVYEHLRPYLHSHSIHWSFGALLGSVPNKIHRIIAAKPIHEMIDELARLDFNGVTVCRKGYPDQAKAIEQELSAILKVDPIQSQDGSLVFYDLRHYKDRLNAFTTAFDRQQYTRLRFMEASLDSKWQKGFHDIQISGNGNFRCCNNKGRLVITNKDDQSIKVKLQFRLETFNKEYATFWIKSSHLDEVFEVNQSGTEFEKVLEIPPGKTVIHFKTNARKAELLPSDHRKLYFRIMNYKLVAIP